MKETTNAIDEVLKVHWRCVLVAFGRRQQIFQITNATQQEPTEQHWSYEGNSNLDQLTCSVNNNKIYTWLGNFWQI